MNAARRLRFVALALLLAIIAILAPGTARTAFADEGYRYIEGQAIVGVLERDGLSIQSELPYTFEELMDVSASAAGVQGVSGGGISVQGDERVVLELVTSSTLTTEELISELERDPRILFAEPNEIITFPVPRISRTARCFRSAQMRHLRQCPTSPDCSGACGERLRIETPTV